MYIRHLEKFGFRFPNHHPDDLDELKLGTEGDNTGDDTDDNTDDNADDNTDDNTDNDNTDDNTDDDNTDDNTDDQDDDDKTDDDTDDDNTDDDDQDDEEDKEDAERYTAFKDIKAAFPDFFKKFPDVRGALAREAQYSEIFGSPEDATIAVKDANVLRTIEEDLLSKHDPIGLLDVVNKNSPEALEAIVLNQLPYLQEKHKDLYYELAAVPIKQLLRNAWAEGKGKETDLGKAAAIIHKFFFKDYEFNNKVKGEGAKVQEKSTREQELEDRLNKIESGKQSDFVKDCDQSYTTRISRAIEERIANDARLTPYMRSKVTEDVMKEIKRQLEKDGRYKSTMQSLIRQAKTNNYSSDSKSRVISTALARAKSLIPEAAKRVISNAVKTRVSNDDKKGKKIKFKPRTEGERKMQSQNRGGNDKQKSDLDILRGA